MELFWNRIDSLWKNLASVKLTIVILVGLLLLSIPGTVVMQHNISNVDPGLVYTYDFWSVGQTLQLFTAYYSFWYVALLVLLSMNLISCSVERWPQMWALATAKPVAWAKETFSRQPEELQHGWKTKLDKDQFEAMMIKHLKQGWHSPTITERTADSIQIFWQGGRWSRISNYVVHTSLLIIFAGGIWSALYGFEGAANIPEGKAVDTFLLFKEGRASGLQLAPGGLSNEKLLGFRIEAEKFDVKFYEEWAGRPESFETKLNILEKGRLVKSGSIRVNEPMQYKGFTFYQSSYGKLGDAEVRARIVSKTNGGTAPLFLRSQLGEPNKIGPYNIELVPLRAMMNIQDLGPGVEFQEYKNDQPVGSPFWVLRDYPQFDLERRKAPYGVILDSVRDLHFTGLQIGSDPGAPLYWFGCLTMLLGTFYALLVTHRKYYLRYERGQILFSATIHRLPIGFVEHVSKKARELKEITT